MSINNVTLVGRLTKDVESKYTQGGMAVAKFILAVNRQFKKDGQPEADFITCTAFNKTAENLANFMRKGSQIGVIGSIQTGSYDDKDGKRVYTTDVICNNIQFLESRQDQQGGQQQSQQQNQGGQANQFNAQQQQNYQNQPMNQQFNNNGPFTNTNTQQNSMSDDDLPF